MTLYIILLLLLLFIIIIFIPTILMEIGNSLLLIVYANVNMACANRDCEQKDPLLGYLRIQKLL